MSKASDKRQERQESIETLRRLLPRGATVYAILDHVSRSGMQRRIKFYTQHESGMVWLGGYIAAVLDYPQDKHTGAVIVNGCGMDMGFHVVHSLCYALFPEDCDKPSSGKPWRNHEDYGYELDCRWL